jgi:hypothetical protein
MRTLSLSLWALAALPLHAGITTEQTGNNIRIDIDGKLFTEYRSDGRVPCLYPLMSPTGTHLTRQFPFVKDVPGEKPDHPHHTGFWFTHGDVNGKDFWHKEDCKIVTKGIMGKPIITNTVSGGNGSQVTFTVLLAWEADGKRHLDEQRTYTIVAEGKTRTIDVTSLLGATDQDAVFGDTKEGSFSIRVAPTLRLNGDVAMGHIMNSEGVTDGDAWGKRAKWVAYHGPDSAGTPTVIAILDHAANLRHPTWWHARDYGLLGANPFGQRAFEKKGDGTYTLKKGQTITQRYRLILHQGDLASAKVEDAWAAFSKKK